MSLVEATKASLDVSRNTHSVLKCSNPVYQMIHAKRSEINEKFNLTLLKQFKKDNQQSNCFIEDNPDDHNGSEIISQEISEKFCQWIDLLGQESAVVSLKPFYNSWFTNCIRIQALKLKQPITFSFKGSIYGSYGSPHKYLDDIHMLIGITTTGPTRGNPKTRIDIEPIGFIRVGFRTLFFPDPNGDMQKIPKAFSALDFYCRIQRQGFGLLIFNQMMSYHQVNPSMIAFDKPTDAMISFLTKHFKDLGEPNETHIKYVIFRSFWGHYP